MSERSYTDKQIDFVINKRVEGYTYEEIAEDFNEKFNEDKSKDAIRYIFSKYKNEYDLPEMQQHPDKVHEKKKAEIMDNFLSFIESNGYVPTQRDLEDLGYTRNTIRHYYTNLDTLDQIAREEYPRVFKKIIDEYSFTQEMYNQLRDKVKDHKKFVITTAVTGCDVHEKGLDTIKNYCKRNKALHLILPCSDPANSWSRKNKWALDHRLPKESVVFRDLKLNNNVFLSTIKLSAKHINPLTGLSRIGQRHGSFIYASPKQALEYVATSVEKKVPRALMTTGAITKAQYDTSYYMSERTGYIADHDHVLGAVIVEIENDKIFYFRQIEIEEKTGAFIDLDKKYFADGRVEKSTADLVQLGDYHVGETDPLAKKVGKDLCALVKPKFLTLEDFFNGHSISHHDEGKCITQSKKSQQGLLFVDNELKECNQELNDISTWKVDEIIIKYGNHEDFLFRWLNRAGYIDQPQNHKTGVHLADAMLNKGFNNPFEYAMKEMFKLNKSDKFRFLTVDDSFMVNGIENGAHGDKGPNGSRNPGLAGLEKCFGKCNVGHSHTAGILRGVYRVGTTSYLKVSYNTGPSSWTQTHLVQHPNGARQLVNCINGKFRLED